MIEKMELDYYYGKEAEQFTFYRLPKALITDPRFKKVTNNAKLLYGLLLDRMSLSRKRGWLDEEGRVYVKYSTINIAEDLNINRKTSAILLKELESFGLVELIRETGKPTVIYVKNFISEEKTESEPVTKTDRSENVATDKDTQDNAKNAVNMRDSGSSSDEDPSDLGEKLPQTCPKITQVPGKKSLTNKNISKNNLNDNNLIHLSVLPYEPKQIDAMDETEAYMDLIRENIDYEVYMQDKTWQDRELYEELYNIICDVVCVKRDKIRIGREYYPYQLVKGKFLKLNSEHLQYVISCMRRNTTKVNNIRAYLITALYNAPNTMDHFYTAEVNHDLYGMV